MHIQKYIFNYSQYLAVLNRGHFGLVSFTSLYDKFRPKGYTMINPVHGQGNIGAL